MEELSSSWLAAGGTHEMVALLMIENIVSPSRISSQVPIDGIEATAGRRWPRVSVNACKEKRNSR